MSITNRQLSKLFKLGAALLELHEANAFKVRSYENAAQQIRSYSESLIDMSEEELEQIEGIGKNLSKKILQIKETGSYNELDELLQQTPPGLLELLQIRGLGAKKIRSIWQGLGITSPEELLMACENNMVQALKGFGKKTEENVRELVEFFFENRGKYLYAEAESEAIRILSYLKNNKRVEQAAMTGELRRKMPVVKAIEILITLAEGSPEMLADEKEEYIILKENNLQSGIMGIPIKFYKTSSKDWVENLMLTTGNENHLELLDANTLKNAESEAKVYELNQMPYVIPEMREGKDEIEIANKVSLEDIIQLKHLKGCLHNHSTWSDGSNSILEMASACKNMGLEYFGLCDHSQAAFYANGMKPDAVWSQMKEIDRINEQLKPFKIFKGIEADILNSGDLDYHDTDLLKEFDFVVASVHSNLKMNMATATKRLLKAIENPYTTILGHLTARLLLMRPGYPVDHKKIIDACAANGVVIEINTNPRRLDIDWQWISYAVDKGVILSLNPDAHDVFEIQNMYYGVCVARKAGLSKEHVLNTYSLEEITQFFEKKKKH